MTMPIALAVFLLIVVVATTHLRAGRSSQFWEPTPRSWKLIMEQVALIDSPNIRALAVGAVKSSHSFTSLNSAMNWRRIGGNTGFRRMWRNADLLLELAAHAQQWNGVCEPSRIEEMRACALSLKREIVWSIVSYYLPVGALRGGSIHRAALAYYRLLFETALLCENGPDEISRSLRLVLA